MAEEIATQEAKWEVEEGPPEDAWGEITYTGNVPGQSSMYLTTDVVVFGRHPGSTVILNHAGSSGKHCILKRMGRRDGESILMLTDLSTNGTYVNNTRIGKNQQVEIKSGQEIVLVRTQTDRLSYIVRAFDQDRELAAEMAHPNGPYHKYVLGSAIGSGAYATVKRCYDKATQQEFAIKVIDKRKFALNQGEGGGSRIYATVEATEAAAAQHNSKLSNTLRAEVEILRSIDHENVIKVFDVFETDRYFYIVLELISGGDLLDFLLENKRPFTEDEARALFWQLVEATDYLHSQQIVHRDIKPENILINKATRKIKLTDFGLSRIVGEGSFMKTVCGTPQYLAPEVLQLAPVVAQRKGPPSQAGYGKAVDLWSLGVILYVMLAAAQPFDENTMVESILAGRFQFPEDRWTGKSAAVKDLIRGLLTVDPEQRYTAEQVRNHEWMQVGHVIRKPPPEVYASGDAMTQSPPYHIPADTTEEMKGPMAPIAEHTSVDSANASEGPSEADNEATPGRKRRKDSERMVAPAPACAAESQNAKRVCQ